MNTQRSEELRHKLSLTGWALIDQHLFQSNMATLALSIAQESQKMVFHLTITGTGANEEVDIHDIEDATIDEMVAVINYICNGKPLGLQVMREGTVHPGIPAYQGQIGVFRSPYCHRVTLVDLAEIDRYGHLKWGAMPFNDERLERVLSLIS
jgi:hypothetical protein